jgi:hypothetical protein
MSIMAGARMKKPDAGATDFIDHPAPLLDRYRLEKSA